MHLSPSSVIWDHIDARSKNLLRASAPIKKIIDGNPGIFFEITPPCLTSTRCQVRVFLEPTDHYTVAVGMHKVHDVHCDQLGSALLCLCSQFGGPEEEELDDDSVGLPGRARA